jgi:acyl-coenzyme A thioesterase PaaI-like protein
MKKEIVNQELLPHNVCFGCGIENPHGLHIEVSHDEKAANRLIGVFRPPSHMIGFPGITHGGVLYTALDCLACWVPTALRRGTKAAWILRSASMTYHKPAKEKEEIHLMGMIEQEGQEWEPMVVHAEARNAQGALLAEGKFKVIPLSAEKFKKVADIEKLPENWTGLLK